MHSLIVFISSTGDLQSERNAVEQILSELDIDGSRFESWPSTPNSAIAECMQCVEESDAIVLILGERYGSLTNDGISVTHLEYHRAKELKKPIFVYLLNVPDREPEQLKFIEEVRKTHFHCPVINNIKDLKSQVKQSFLQEFTRCFRKVHSYPPEEVPSRILDEKTSFDIIPPNDPQEAYLLLEKLYLNGKDLTIHQLAQQCELKFSKFPEIMNLVFMAEVNFAMDGGLVIPEQLIKAIEFWDSHNARTRWQRSSLIYNQANALSALKRFDEAIERYQAALVMEPDFAQCWKNLGSAYLALDDVASSRQCYEKALSFDPQLFEALYCLAVLSMQRENNPQTALSYLNRIKTSHLSSYRLGSIYGWKAVAFMKLGYIVEGVASAEDAINAVPESEWAWLIAGRLYALARQKDYKWLGPAVTFWERFVTKYSDNAEAWAEFGYVYWFLREYKDKTNLSQLAHRAFLKAIDLGLEDSSLVWDRIGHLYQEQFNWQEAEKAYRQAAQMNPNQFGYCFGVSLIFLKRYEEALPWVLEAAQKHQPDAKSWFQVGVCKEKLGNFVEAVEAYEKAIQLDPNYPEPLFNLGGLYWNKGNISEGKATWEKALAKFPEHELCKRVRDCLKA